MKEYSRYKYNIQDNNPPSLHLLTQSFSRYYTHTNKRTHTHTHMHRYTLIQVADSCLMQQGQWKVTGTLNIHHTDYKPDGMLLRLRTCVSVCVRVSEWVRIRRWDVTLL